MSLQFPCPSCGKELRAPDAAAGKVGKCKACGASAVVPSRSGAAPESALAALADPSSPKSTKPIPPATERQKEYARDLDVTFPDDINIRDMSTLIDAAKEKEDAERRGELDRLSDKESAAYARIRDEILEEIDADDCRLSTATIEQIIEALEEREIAAILLAGPSDPAGREPVQCTVSFTSDLSEEAVAARLLESCCAMMKRTHPAVARLLEDVIHGSV